MAVLKAFRALRPAPAFAEQMVSPPYDVVDRKQAAALAEGKPFSHLHVCRSEIDFPEGTDPYCAAVYEKAKENIEKALEAGALMQEKEPAYYLYRQDAYGKSRLGYVGCVSVEDYLNDVIKKHEVTLAEKEEDRLRHFTVCSCHTEPVFLAYRSNEKAAALAEERAAARQPDYDVTDAAGVRHRLWVVDGAADKAQIRAVFSEMDHLYIADGHHRCASAARAGLACKAANPHHTGEEEYNFFMAVCFPEDQLDIWDYSRMVKDLNGLSSDEFLKALEKAGFAPEEAGEGPYIPEAPHRFGLLLEGKWYRLSLAEVGPEPDALGSLDVSLLQKRLLSPILGIEDPRRDPRIAFVGGKDRMEIIRQKMADKEIKAAILLYPVRMGQIMAVADMGRTMPPKSTWFEPKLGSGLFLHRF